MNKAKQYRKKPIVIKAIQFTDKTSTSDLESFMGSQGENFIYTNIGRLVIETLGGSMTAQIGDYIIKGVQGEFYPCKPDIFEATYEEVEWRRVWMWRALKEEQKENK